MKRVAGELERSRKKEWKKEEKKELLPLYFIINKQEKVI
ncbi:hypothetical protein SD78_3833 [Bacillus badius]|nr:hypothetical protein SD78_3833 [Bacillus badius]